MLTKNITPHLSIRIKNHKGRLYHNGPIPQGAEMIDEVIRGGWDSGALVKFGSGVYVQMNAGVIRALHQPTILRLVADLPDSDRKTAEIILSGKN